jgi:hypothetical protein
MTAIKTRSLEKIENKMQSIGEGSFRYKVLDSVKKFKTSWLDLGQALYAVYKDRLYKEWGFMTFEAYVSKEINIQRQTAVKLLKSYYFLEKEEPDYLRKDQPAAEGASSFPSYEAVNLLRLAKNRKDLGPGAYANLKKEVFQEGKEAREVRKGLTALIRERQELSPDEARKKKQEMTLRRFLSTLKTLRRDLEISKLVSAAVLKETDALIRKIEAEI